ncbi:AMP-binding protein [Corallococcus sp. bb12-1]|uniref:AMP-binding protein n=1 Tax=Corallococcus sp. bb12-1 TaxID=2996784 RepID=UPI0022710633|nr:AMP-binding protein [Corallococcus sp. bb12-1]MCY1047766.1 AMP-binding protein [Corallococcus sp. bb12-1]
MNSADGSENNFGLTSSLVDLLCPRAEKQGAARLYWFQETGDAESTTEEWSFAHLEARAQALGARLQAGSEDERVLMPCHELEQATHTDWSEPAEVPSPDDARCLPAQFRAQVARTPDAVAVAGDDETLTYAELDARSDALAWHLREQGVAPEVRVGLSVERCAGMVVAMLGILKAGGVCIALDPDAPRAMWASVLEDSGARVLVTQSHRDSALTAEGVRTVFVDSEEAFELGVLGPPRAGTTPEDLASVLYPAGDGGSLAGVRVSHTDVARFFGTMDSRMGNAPMGTWLAVPRLARDSSMLELLWALMRGFRVVARTA